MVGLQHLCGQFERSLGRCGLTLNVEKSRTLRIAVSGKAKRWVCEPTPFVSLAGGLMPAVTITQAYKYLGVHISAREQDTTHEEILTRGLNQLKSAPLKPQQRLYILRAHLLPKLDHKLVLSRTRGGVLNRLDRVVRKSVRAITACDCCGRTETLGHVLQVCHRSWGSRIKRHDALMEKFLHSLEIRGGSIVRAPVIPVVGSSPQIPDGVVYFQSHCWVVDASVVADNADLDNAHLSKCAKYDTPAVRDWCQSNWPSHEGTRGSVRFGALIFNWRGVMSRRSARMCEVLKINKATMKLFAVCVVEHGWRIYRDFHRCTARW